MSIIGNQEMIRVTNQTLILNLIKEKGSISRADIAKNLKLSPPSTSSNINRLLDIGLISEIGEGASAGGRKPILLELNKDFGFIVGIDLSGEEMQVSIGNINAELMDTVSSKARNDSNGIELFIDIIESINSIITRNKIVKEKIKIIIIAIPGIYDSSVNKFVTERLKVWNDIDISGALKSEFKVDVIIKNNMSTAALGEFKFGIKKQCKNMLFVNADDGIGAGLIINGMLYEGSFGAAGMMSSIVFSKDNIGGIYKKNGYLETTVSTTKLTQRIKNLCKNDNSVLELCSGNINNLDFGIIKRAYEKNNLVIRQELDKVVDLIAMTIANINILLDLDTIILSGKLASFGEYYIISIKKITGELCTTTPYISYSTLKDNSTIFGMFAMGQENILNGSF